MSENMENTPEVEKVTAEVAVDLVGGDDIVQGWFDEAMEVTTLEALQKLSKRVLETPMIAAEAIPHAYTSIVLASLKMALSSKHGSLSKKQWFQVQDLIDAAIFDVTERMA